MVVAMTVLHFLKPLKNGGWKTILSWERALGVNSLKCFGEGKSFPHICKVGPYDRCKWSYNPYKWPYKWATGVITFTTLLIGVPFQSICNDRRGPPCLVNCHPLDHRGIWILNRPLKSNRSNKLFFLIGMTYSFRILICIGVVFFATHLKPHPRQNAQHIFHQMSRRIHQNSFETTKTSLG